MTQAYNHASAEAKTYQGKPPTVTPYQQVRSGGQIQPNEKTSTFQTVAAHHPASFNASPSQQTYQSQGKRKDFHPHQSHFNKKNKGHYRDIVTITPIPKQLTQWANRVSRQALPRGMRHTHL
ncbi:hypothetical protein EV1_032478 [Malus domestica]